MHFLIYFKFEFTIDAVTAKCQMRVKTTKHTFPWGISKIPKFNLTAEKFPKITHQDKEWIIVIFQFI
jgi:hypothetical protein